MGISQVNLAERVGTSTQYIGQIEQNKKFPSPEMLERIAEALEIDSPQLFSMEAYSQTAINQFKENLKINLEKAIDDFIDKGLNEVEILEVNGEKGNWYLRGIKKRIREVAACFFMV